MVNGRSPKARARRVCTAVFGAKATVGGYAALAPFIRVGAYAYIGGCSKVVADVPPFMLVDGTPAVVRSVNVIGLRRSGMPAEQRGRLQSAYRLLYRSGLAPRSALERIRAELPGGEPLVRERAGGLAAALPRNLPPGERARPRYLHRVLEHLREPRALGSGEG